MNQIRMPKTNAEYFKLIYKYMLTNLHILVRPPKEKITPAFSEKIMLAVTGVNQCTYCSYLHTETALKKGVSQEEIEMLLEGTTENHDKEESIGLLFAQHWADTRGNTTEESREKLVNFYGKGRAFHIEFFIITVYTGNMSSNLTFGYKDKILTKWKMFQMFPSYIVALPIAFGINNTGKILGYFRKRKTK